MLSLHNITKKYFTGRGEDCVALNDISLELPDRGLVAICGKSGSGKSTLLNILGGMDRATSGEVRYFDRPIEKIRDLLAVGFVFQEYHLMATMTVGENIALPLSLPNIGDKVRRVSAALASVGLSNLQNRRINELSGGQKQRVAIARALVKEPKIILADEPTGNLDSQTAAEIFDLLKELSKNRLVVVVTHDIESAKKYHDYLIELEDGKIKFTNCKNQAKGLVQPIEMQSYPKKSKPPALANAFRQALRSFNDYPMKAFSVIFSAVLAIVCLTVLLMFYSLGSFDTKLSIVESINPRLFNARYESDDLHNFPQSVLDELYTLQPSLRYLKCENEFIISGSQDILDFGLSFVGDSFIELNDNTLYITDLALSALIKNGLYTKNYLGEEVEVTQNTPVAQIIGIAHPAFENSVIGGIVDTSALRHGESNLDSPFLQFFQMPFHLSGFVGRLSIQSFFSASKTDIFLGNTQYQYTKDLEINNKSKMGYVLDLNGQILQDYQLLDGQAAVSLHIYNELFDERNSLYDFVYGNSAALGGVSLRKIPEHLGQKLRLELNEIGHQLKLSYEITIVGIIIDTSVFVNDELIILSDHSAREINDTFICTDLLIDANSIIDMRAFFRDADSLGLDLYYPYHDITDKALLQSSVWVFVFVGLSMVLMALAIMVIINMISLEIRHKSREMGILRALGARDFDLFAPLFAEAGILSAAIFSINTALAFLIANALEYVFADEFVILGYSKYFRLFSVSWLTILPIFLVSFLATLIPTAVPVLRIKKLAPIDAIKR